MRYLFIAFILLLASINAYYAITALIHHQYISATALVGIVTGLATILIIETRRRE